MDFSSTFYITTLAIVFLVGILIDIGIYVLGRGDPDSTISNNYIPIMAGIAIVTLLIGGFLGWKAWDARGQPVNDDNTIASQVFDYDRYLATHQEDLITNLTYGEEFVPKYDKSLLTLITTDFEFKGFVGENKVPLVFEDSSENIYTIEYTVYLIDKDPPVLTGIEDIHLDYGRLFSKDNLKIMASDPIDGELPFEIDGVVDTNTPGVYKMLATTEDFNSNKVSEEFYVIVGGKNDILVGDTIPVVDEYENVETPEGSEKLTEVAMRVINGDYGWGVKRQYYLAKDGYNYLEVQKEVEKLQAAGYNGPGTEEEPTKEEPVVEEPVKEEPVKEEPVVEEPVKEEPIEEEPVVEEPVKEEPVKEGNLSTEEVAKQVIKGQYGNGAARRANLKAAGYDYETVQAQVNNILLGS